MRVGFVFTNYNNSEYTKNAIISIVESVDVKSFQIVIVDNKSDQTDVDKLKDLQLMFPFVHFIYNSHNVGYFKGLNTGIEYLRKNETDIDYIVIGNNDLVFPDDFMKTLFESKDIFKSYPVISPDLVTLDGVHQNPHVAEKINPLREMIWDIYYFNYNLAQLIKKISVLTRPLTERKDHHQHSEPGEIYQGYGACYILGPIFFENFELLWAPTFLMGEEFFLTRQLENKGFNIYYEPSIKVKHHDHASTSNVPEKKIWEISSASHKTYRQHVGWFNSKIKIKN